MWKKTRFQSNIRTSRYISVLILLPPALLLFTMFVAFPLIEAGYYSFFKWNGYGSPTEYVGITNYTRMLKHSVFSIALWNTLKIIVVSLTIQLPIALFVALAIYKKTWTNNIFRLVFFLPYILAEVATGLVWTFVYDGDAGVIKLFTNLIGIEPLYLLGQKETVFLAILVVIVWKYIGFHMIIYIAGLQSVPEELIEAAQIDGASPWQIIRYVKIPLIMPSIRVSVFLSIIGGLQAFDIVIPLATGGGPAQAGNTLVTYLYLFGIVRMKIGFGSAVGLVLFIITIVFSFTYKKSVMRDHQVHTMP